MPTLEMNRQQLVQRVRSMTRDFAESIFRANDIYDWINEAISRFAQVIPELSGLEFLHSDKDVPKLIPLRYRHLLAVYAASRCFGQDERHYQASTYMNEFEVKLDELKTAIENGEVVIEDEDGNPVTSDIPVDYVDLEPYWGIRAKPTELPDAEEVE